MVYRSRALRNFRVDGGTVNSATNLIGQNFGKLRVIARAGSWKDGSALWLCRCECGTERTVPRYVLYAGKAKACKKCRAKKAGCWTAEEETRLRALYPATSLDELALLFPARTESAIRSRARVLRLRKAKQRKEWTAADRWMLYMFFPHIKTEILAQRLRATTLATGQMAQKLGLRKSAIYLASPDACRLRRGDNVGAAFRFGKGHEPANKGLRRPGWAPGRMRETQFQKGSRTGAANNNYKPVWTILFDHDGYLRIKTRDGRPKQPGESQLAAQGWEYVHKLIWERWNGPLPDWREARIWWKDGDHGNCSLSNLELVKASEHMRRTSVHNLPKPLAQVIQLAGALKRKIRNKEKKSNGQEHAAGFEGSSVRDARSAG